MHLKIDKVNNLKYSLFEIFCKRIFELYLNLCSSFLINASTFSYFIGKFFIRILRFNCHSYLQSKIEMQETMPSVISKLQAEQIYLDQFFKAFGDENITEERIALALEQFMFSIVSVNSKYDRSENNQATLTASEQRGKDLFFNEYNPSFPSISGADCAHCHSGARTTRNFARPAL